MQSLTDKIEQVQQSRGENVAFGHLEDRIVKLVEKLDASDRGSAHLEAVERGLTDLLVHIEDIETSKDLGACARDGIARGRRAQARHRPHARCGRRRARHARPRGRTPRRDRARHSWRDALQPAMPADEATAGTDRPAAPLGVRMIKRRARRAGHRLQACRPSTRCTAFARHPRGAAADAGSAEPAPERLRRPPPPSACRPHINCRLIPICRPISRSSPAPARRLCAPIRPRGSPRPKLPSAARGRRLRRLPAANPISSPPPAAPRRPRCGNGARAAAHRRRFRRPGSRRPRRPARQVLNERVK